MDMRQYDPSIARWTSLVSVKHWGSLPYQAFDNNTIYWVDPSGADSIYNFNMGKYVINGIEVIEDEAIRYVEN